MTAPTDPAGAAPRPLRRPRDGRLVGGVCGAVADRFGIEIAFVRLGAVLLIALGGVGLAAYVAGVLLIPEEGEDEPLLARARQGERRPIVFALLGVLLLSIAAMGAPLAWWGHGWWLALLAAAVVVVALRHLDGAAVEPADVRTELREGARATAATVRTALRREPRRRRGGAAALTLGAALLVLAAAGAVLAATGADVRWDQALAGAVVAVGVALVVGAFFGGLRALVPLGLLLALVAGVAAAADLDLRGGVGDRVARPLSVAELSDEHLSAGNLVLDLRQVSPPPGVHHVAATVGFGQLRVRLPRGVTVRVHGRASGGEVVLPGTEVNGLDADRRVVVRGDPRRVLDLDLKVGFGELKVTTEAAR